MSGDNWPKTKRKNYMKAWRVNNRDRELNNRYKRQYGITLLERDAMALAQGHKCAGCSEPFDAGLRLAKLDHCHATGRVRGLLCNACNVILGMAKDRPAVLAGLIRYLGA